MDDKMVKCFDSKNNEWIVDGDLYLIKTISQYPILWDRKNFDSDQRNEVWLKLSKKLKIKLEWMKKRWSYLREQYVRHLKQINNDDKPSKRNYKYFNEMSFLANHIQIRNGNYQDVISNIACKALSTEANSTTDSCNIAFSSDQDDVVENENENVDFVITENEIEAYNDDDDDLAENVFVELSDEENDQQQQNDSRHSEINTSMEFKLLPSYENKKKSDIISKAINPVTYVLDVKTNNSKMEHLAKENGDATNGNVQTVNKPTESTESRCEDVIFGELVATMLKKMDSPNRKRAKKEILNILLS